MEREDCGNDSDVKEVSSIDESYVEHMNKKEVVGMVIPDKNN